jgi:hypothetical protein
MTTMTRFLLILTVAAAMARPVYAYDAEETHRKMTIVATEKSVLYTDPSIMKSLGLFASPEFRYYARTGMLHTGLKDYKLSEFLAEGAVEEDSPVTRVRHHFFDPVKDRPLSIGCVPVIGCALVAGYRSWEYMLEPNDQILGQDNSLRDARFYLHYGLLYKTGDASGDEGQRDLALSIMLRSLGHVMHHMQDMAQPQHVRNDQHLSGIADSRYEAYTKERGDELLPLMNSAVPVYPGSPEFQTARDFWFNAANTGIAQTVNREFLSYGTNFHLSASGAATGEYASPAPAGSADFTPQDLGLTLLPSGQAQCANPGINCTMTMYATPTTQRASTLSVFDQDLRITGVSVNYLSGTASTQRFFDLNRFNLAAVHPVLIPRAVAYSAGIVNHFFRGKLEITAPATGPYAVVDHSTGQGFRRIRATVKNLTKDEKLTGGDIRLIATYHLNKCYKPDLTGEFQSDGAGGFKEPCPEYRSTEEYISIGAPQQVSFDVDESKQLSFTLDEAIPINATDLMFQIYYTGGVGAEAESFALGSIDVSEPTFVAGMNATDVYDLAGNFYYWRYIVEHIAEQPFSVIDVDKNGIYAPPNDISVTGGSFNFQIFVNGLKVADAPFVPEGRFTRIAVIVDTTGFKHRIVATSSMFSRADDDFHFPAKINQYDFDRNEALHNDVFKLRNDTLQFGAVSVYGYYPRPGADIHTMPKSEVTDSTVVVPVVLTAAVQASAVTSAAKLTSSDNVTSTMRDSAFAEKWQNDQHDMPAQPRRVPSPDAKPVDVTPPGTIQSQAIPLPPNPSPEQ